MQQATAIVEAARRLIIIKGSGFTTHELAKEAGVALQTFYRYFAGKDQLLLAVIEDMVSEACDVAEQESESLPDPVSRLRFSVLMVFRTLGAADHETAGPRFITGEHWRLQRLYPAEMEHATRPFTELILRHLRVAAEQGLLAPKNPEYDAWLANQLVLAVYHHYAFAPTEEPPDVIAERVWGFCLGALGGGQPAAAATSTATTKRRSR
jgi:AcrR family transcriptional regulator